MKKALLVIDMQEDYLKDYSINFVDKINKKILQANSVNEVIAYIKNKKILKSGNIIPEFAFGLEVISTNIFYKEKAETFSRMEINSWLAEKEIDTIELIGVDDQNNSIIKTAVQAKKQGYNVILHCNLIATENNISFIEKREELEKAGIKVLAQ